MFDMKEFVEILNEKIRNRAVSVAGLAKYAGCSRQAIYDILKGVHEPNFRLMQSLGECVGVEFRMHFVEEKEEILSR